MCLQLQQINSGGVVFVKAVVKPLSGHWYDCMECEEGKFK